ncbi:Pyridoxal phosphate enzyme, YggS family [Corynebacterium kutscheri]|uniref:Pyridoxal phosphate homeostasis protein n=1 Tax=Corynebacterium kutscheri TaxID=35755 RepID=A0A0F6QZ42_9CORY|nr:YggS family pyridoxal phosphate-dependent enzyme [Corynebacterium kutscheri]AKE40922.1 pyridoxal phosphate enzyme, YggS family [Corynebacterium kutscheri]VEH09221.1 Pyridoxal phosphate enzyme, YggS family [Corynebacterium kutscheri]VEH79307.1 Pyridoxal phosphate enzyme, YggS family [Corynebacterium kutscheri]
MYPRTVADFRTNIDHISARITDAAQRAQRDPHAVRLVAVSKTHPVEHVQLGVDAGLRVLGENKPQELAVKAQNITGVSWCAIGHVQRNKAREIAHFADEFHALDSLRLAETLHKRLIDADRTLTVLVQVNTSMEAQKGGFPPDEVAQFLDQIAAFDRLQVRGLMTMAALSPEEKIVRHAFSSLRELRDQLAPNIADGMSLEELSMGMSGDFEWAIAEGSTCVRIGTALFGTRPIQG